MSELRGLIDEAKSNLQNLHSLLQTAKSLGRVQGSNSALSRDEIQKYFEEILKMIEKLPDNLKLEENIQEKDEIMNLLLQMEKVRQTQAVSKESGSSHLALQGKTGLDQPIAHEKPVCEATAFLITPSNADPLIQNALAVSAPDKGQRQSKRKTPSAGEGLDGFRELPKGVPVKEAQPNARSQEVKCDSKWASKSDRKKLAIVWLVSANLLLGGVLGICLLLGPTRIVTGSLEIQSVPEGANVLMDEALKGQTPLRIESVDARDYALRIEKQGYIPLTRELSIDKGQTTRLYVQLERPNIQPTDLVTKHDAAQTLFSHGMKNASPGEAEVLSKLKTPKRKLTGPLEKTNPVAAGLTERIQGLRRQISSAIHSGNYFPPNPANAMQLLKQLNELSPEDTFGQDGLDQIYRELTSLLQRQLQARDIENARTVARQLQTYFPERSESHGVQDILKAEETKLLEAQEAWIQKVESGMAAGRYVTPSNDNVLFYCNQALLTDPQNPKVLQLRKESIIKAAARANEWVQIEKFDGAREIFSILLQLSDNESSFPFTSQELKGKLDNLEFNAYPVIHDHTIGSCTGRLRMNGFVISFVPTGDSKDGFTQKLAEISQVEPGDKLKIQFKNKTYRFQANLMTSLEAKREKVNAIYQNLSRRVAMAK
jgi:hypothetical protein